MSKSGKREPKSRNKAWMRARIEHSNRNNTVPSGDVYKRRPKHRDKGWE